MAGQPSFLALDFDGVICDALEECALVTWLGIHPHDRTLPGPEQLRLLPREFVERFRTVRDYARTLDHFVIAHLPEAATLRGQADFDRLYEALPPSYVRKFTDAANAAREWFRTRESDFWLDLHTLYPGVPELLRRHSGSVVIVTAKDEGSVHAILGRHGLDDTVAAVYGECGRKAEAIREISDRWGVALKDVTFVDDNLTNAVRVARTGAVSRWAQWGYQTPEHRAQAQEWGVSPLHLDGLAGLVPAGV
ncbi:HAD family hydrolase [Streptomyces sp. NBC_00525]|uniref:HAD family hydrolase n=1 Tax=Streptomyces sp. NBC_00525 TaxID=2903660 RepID=UPI002E8141BF|nr:HAD family hydrolase [Streptomyces sp. NBC_00525]WUC95464.1 HAD family hydrolase [Streptomyces sp. NBC_00525]